MARALRAWAINRGGKNSVRNLRYGPRTRLVRGIHSIAFDTTPVLIVNLFSIVAIKGYLLEFFTNKHCFLFLKKIGNFSIKCSLNFFTFEMTLFEGTLRQFENQSLGK